MGGHDPLDFQPDAVRRAGARVDERDDVISLQDYLVVLKRQRLLIVAVTVLVVSAALGVSFAQTPVYEASTDVIIDPVRRTQDISLEDLRIQASGIETERLVITSGPVAQRAADELSVSDPADVLEEVRVESVRDTRVVRVIAADTDPAAAARRANAIADAYLGYRRDEAVEEIVAARADLEERAASLRAQLAELEGGEEGDAIERGALVTQLSAVIAQISELGGGGSAAVTGGGSILAAAEVPDAPVSPQPLRTGALALVLGVLLGVGLAFLRDHFDDVIRDEADFKRTAGGRPILGRIPNWEDPEGANRLAAVLEPHSLASESYRELSAGVRFLLLAHGTQHEGDGTTGGRSIMLSSAHAGEGKTSTAANLAVAAARVGLRTLLVDADLRRPTVHKRFGLGRTTGLTDVLLSGGGLDAHLTTVGIDGLELLPAGTLPPNPNELLASPAMRAVQREALLRADLVIYDTPAVLAVPDALELARHVDAAILVGRIGTTSRRQLAAAIERVEQVGGEVAGTVLNDLDPQKDGYYYSYYYLDPEAEEDGGRASRKRPPRRRRASRSAGSGAHAAGLDTVEAVPAADRSAIAPVPGATVAPADAVAAPAADVEPADAEPTDAEPADAEPTDAQPADAEPADAEPADDGPAADPVDEPAAASAPGPSGERLEEPEVGDPSAGGLEEDTSSDADPDTAPSRTDRPEQETRQRARPRRRADSQQRKAGGGELSPLRQGSNGRRRAPEGGSAPTTSDLPASEEEPVSAPADQAKTSGSPADGDPGDETLFGGHDRKRTQA